MLKTNFYQPTKAALSFRLAPDFLPEVEYPNQQFGVIFYRRLVSMAGVDFAPLNYIVSNKFHGFRMRFRDVARSGIQIVR